MKLNVKSLTKGLQYHGEVEGMRQRYHVLSSPKHYFVMSVSRAKRDAGNFNLVAAANVERLYRRLRGRKGLTAKQVFTRARNKRMLPSSLAALNVLYVLVATGRATIDRRRQSRELFFNVLKSA